MTSSGSESKRGESQTSSSGPESAPRRGGDPGGVWVWVGAALIAAVTLIFIWWAWKDGAYFGVVFLPGAMLVYALLIVLLIGVPLSFRLDGAARIALFAIVGVAAWTLLSFAWTDNHDGAVQAGERAVLYAAMFALGLWACRLVGRRRELPLAALAVTGFVIGVVITITLAAGTQVAEIFHDDATLRFPIGYRNGEALFLLVCFWPTIALAAEGNLPWQVRALLLGSATMLLDLVAIAQSRGSLPAAVISLAVFIALSPHRLRAAVFLALAALPVLPALPVLLDLFQHGEFAGLVPFMRDAARAIAFSSLASVALAAVCLRGIGPRLRLNSRTETLISRVVAGVAVAVIVVGSTVFFAQRGGPIHFIDQRASEFSQVGYPDLSGRTARFGTNVGSNRHDFWRVAWEGAGSHPLNGAGAGSWQFEYLVDRRADETPKDPHSLEFLFLSELGIVGVLLLATFFAAVVVAGLRSRRLDTPTAMLVAGSLTAGANFLFHASYDWFWPYPALVAPVMFLLGAAVAPALTSRASRSGGWPRWAGTAAVGLALLLAVPLFLSQRYAKRAYAEYPQDPAAAVSDLDRSADLDPYDPQPLYAQGTIQSRAGNEAQAVAAFREAVDRQPANYAGHYFLANELQRSDPAAARKEVSEAMRLNPFDLKSRALAKRLGLELKKIRIG